MSFKPFRLVLAVATLPLGAQDRTLFEKARACERSGDLKGAETAYRLYFKQNPSSAEALSNLGVVLARQEKYGEAIQAYQRALHLRPSLAAIQLNLGLAYYKGGQPGPAAVAFESYLRKDPANRRAKQLLATALLELDRYEQAARVFESLLPTDDFTVRLGLATAYIRLHRSAEAQKILDEVVRKADSAGVQLALGQAYLGVNDFEGAVNAFRRALELKPSLPGVHFYLGAVYWKQQNEQRAVEEWRKQLTVDASSFDALFALGAALAETGDRDQAWPLLQKANRLRPGHAATLYYLGKLGWKERRPEALQWLERSVKLDPHNRAARYLLAQAYRDRGRAKEAEKELEAVRLLSAKGVQADIDILEAARQGDASRSNPP